MEPTLFKEQLQAKEDMLARTTQYLLNIQNELEAKNKEVSEINIHIFESIKFAALIQTSLLPDVEVLKIFVADAAYRVMQQMGIGGDAVLIKNTNAGVLFGLMDCTGHGIPAAMLSIGSILMLNEITASMEVNSPAMLLQLLNYRLNNTFNASQSLAHLEGSLCFLSSDSGTITYASARGKMLLCSHDKIIELPCTKQSIGDDLNAEYRTHEIVPIKGDRLVMYSDGLTDQFGGEKNKKFTKARLKQILHDNFKLNVKALTALLESEHLAWKKNCAQTDDVSFIILEF